MNPAGPTLETLSDADLEALRLGAQVLAHRARSDGHPAVARYFAQLEDALKAEIAQRGATRNSTAPGEVARPDRAEDRRLVAESLDLLIENERLSPPVRDVCRALRERQTR